MYEPEVSTQVENIVSELFREIRLQSDISDFREEKTYTGLEDKWGKIFDYSNLGQNLVNFLSRLKPKEEGGNTRITVDSIINSDKSVILKMEDVSMNLTATYDTKEYIEERLRLYSRILGGEVEIKEVKLNRLSDLMVYDMILVSDKDSIVRVEFSRTHTY